MRHTKGKIDLLSGATLYLNKPLGWSSFALVNKFRYLASQHLGVKRLKVGHAGTLDPLATGVMILCTGKHTKQIEELQSKEKEYVATIRLGATTPTLDLESQPDHFYPIDHITQGFVEEALSGFVGEIDQVPPIFSACKVQGQRAYDLARKGRDIELASKRITIYEIELLSFCLPDITIRIRCGKGTYIRSLARDIGQTLNSGGHLIALERTCVGAAQLSNCIEVEDIPQWLVDYVDIEPVSQQK